MVTITGPNTGGKTAALKTLGLAAAMAKAGLHVPGRGARGGGTWTVPWFDAVMVDIGDSQDMLQSLSTFSGHITRIQRMLTSATQRSLVLLDELGSGTDPTEGSLLAGALLEELRTRAALTVATTHMEPLKGKGLLTSLVSWGDGHVAPRDGEYQTVAVGFDPERLAPTYELIWG